ncbi:MAG: M48 family metalloprotease [Bdellovibrionota bacterium]
MIFFRPRPVPNAADLITRFLRLPEHGWIVADRALLDRIAGFLRLLPVADLVTVLEERRLLLLYCNQRMSCAFHQFEGREVVLIFPDLKKLLLSAQYLQGYAVLAHELGHVALGHAQKEIHPMQAQLEADQYAAGLGFAEELTLVLRVEQSYDEVRDRLAALRAR